MKCVPPVRAIFHSVPCVSAPRAEGGAGTSRAGPTCRGAIRGGWMRAVELCGSAFLLRVDTMNYLQKTKNAEAHLILMNLMRYNAN